MNHFPAQDKIALEATASERHAAQARLKDYLGRTGMHEKDFAKRIGFGYSTVRFFLKDQYHMISGNDANIRRAIAQYIDAHPIQSSRPVVGELFETGNVRLIRETFAKLLDRPQAFMIYAPPGSQKSFVLEHEIYNLNARELAKPDGAGIPRRAYYVYARQDIRPQDMMKRIALACGCDSTGGTDRILGRLQVEFSGQRVIAVIDEAQHLSLQCFEVIRELLDRDPYFSLLFAGSHDLFLKLERATASMGQLHSRILHKVRLPGCTQEEALAIVKREVGHILETVGPARSEKLALKVIAGATVVDAYVPVKPGQPAATYINIRTLCYALDELRSQYEAKHAPGPAVETIQEESAA